MRYYKIAIKNPTTGAEVKTYTSFVNDKTVPGALNIELDIPVVAFAQPMGAGIVRVWGISLQEIGQASNLNGMAISVYGGMQKGLPLANPAQAGLLVQGFVFQAFGNWIGLDQTLDLIIQPNSGTIAQPKNIVIDWKKGTPLAGAIASTLSTAFPGYQQKINISPKLVLSQDEPGFYSTMAQFAQYVKDVSKSIAGGTYQGVDILLTETTFTVDDGSTQTSPTQIQFQDMIGQPTWLDSVTVQTKFVMRADLKVMDYIKFPPALVTSAAESVSPLINAKATFQGTFQINQIRHVGNFRQADAASWITTVDAFSTAPATA